MTNEKQLNTAVIEAVEKIEAYILKTTGEAPTPEELSSALTRYFVLKEIADFVKMSRADRNAS